MSSGPTLIPETQDARAVTCVAFAGLIKLVWRARRSWAKVLYLLNRYGTLATYIVWISGTWGIQMTNTSCAYVLTFGDLVGYLLTAGVGSALVFFRVYALYNRSRLVLFGIGSLLVAQIITGFTIAVLACTRSQVAYVESLGLCGFEDPFPYSWIAWVPMIIYDVSIFGLICFKTWRHVRASIRTPVLSAVLQDGVLYFGVVLGTEFLSVLGLLLITGPLSVIGAYFTYSLPSLMVSRIFLHLRSIATPQQWTTATEIGGASVIRVNPTWTRTATRHGGDEVSQESEYELEDRGIDTSE